MAVKRTRSGTAKRKSLEGKVQALNNMPLEIVYKVFSYFEPSDLLQIARATQSLRKLVFDKANRTLWVQARENVPHIPPRPEHISEPAYASLLFDKHCDMCSQKSRVTYPVFDLNVRYCKSCKSKLENDAWRWKLSPAATQLPLEIRRGFDDISVYIFHYYSSLDYVLQRLKSAGDNVEQSQEVLAELHEEFERKQIIGAAWEVWEKKLRDKRDMDLRAKRERRINEIKQRARDLGYADVVEGFSSNWSQVRGIRRSEDLTEESWQELEPRLIKFLENERNRMAGEANVPATSDRCREFRAAFSKYRQSHSARTTFDPSVSDLFIRDEVRDYLLGEEQILDREDLYDWMDTLVENWRNAFKEACAAEFPTILGITAANVLDCPLALFSCKFCQDQQSHPVFTLADALEHSCFKVKIKELLPNPWATPLDADQYRYRMALTSSEIGISRVMRKIWYPRCLLVDSRAIWMSVVLHSAEEGIMQHMLSFMPSVLPLQWSPSGEPAIANLYSCKVCCGMLRDDVYVVTTWRGAIHHYEQEHSNESSSSTTWRALDRDEESHVRFSAACGTYLVLWICKHCSLVKSKAYDRSELNRHMFEEHGGISEDNRPHDPDIYYVADPLPRV